MHLFFFIYLFKRHDRSTPDSSSSYEKHLKSKSSRNSEHKAGYFDSNNAFDAPSITRSEENWNNSTTLHSPKLNPARYDEVFVCNEVEGLTERVSICWFYNPTKFFCQRESNQVSIVVLIYKSIY